MLVADRRFVFRFARTQSLPRVGPGSTGREAEANEAIARLLELQPNFRISEWVARDGLSRTQMMYIDGLRKAGVPE